MLSGRAALSVRRSNTVAFQALAIQLYVDDAYKRVAREKRMQRGRFSSCTACTIKAWYSERFVRNGKSFVWIHFLNRG